MAGAGNFHLKYTQGPKHTYKFITGNHPVNSFAESNSTTLCNFLSNGY